MLCLAPLQAEIGRLMRPIQAQYYIKWGTSALGVYHENGRALD